MKYFIILLLAVSIFSCKTKNNHQENISANNGENKVQVLGTAFTDSNKVALNQAILDLPKNNGSYKVRTSGTVSEVCKVKGCWMTLNLDSNKTIRVTFKDYGFFVPKDIAGKNVEIEGVLAFDTTTVDMLKHYAEDAGKTEAEIAMITEPEISPSFEATSVLIK